MYLAIRVRGKKILLSATCLLRMLEPLCHRETHMHLPVAAAAMRVARQRLCVHTAVRMLEPLCHP